MRYSNKYDWETRDDADTLRRFQEIKKDPERLRKAQEYIKDTIADYNESLGIPAPPPVPGRKNPATIMELGNGLGFKR